MAQTRRATGLGRVVLGCSDLAETVSFFCEELDFQLDAIWPADHPVHAILSTSGVRVELRTANEPGLPAGHLVVAVERLFRKGVRAVTAPNGTHVEIVSTDPPLAMPEVRTSLVVSHLDPESSWIAGRAGMLYRDLVPDRQGGRYIASQIRIPDGGVVPDYVHYHDVRFQMIFCAAGWVRVVYEDQGAPFVLHAGDCVLQPPRIRHRVLEASAGLEVIEVGCPAEHLTMREHDLALPTPVVRPERTFGGQRFVRHIAAESTCRPWRLDGFECRDTGISAATDGLADVRVARQTADVATRSAPIEHHGEYLQLYVLRGSAALEIAGTDRIPIAAGTSVVIPPSTPFSLDDITSDLELLDIQVEDGQPPR
jgi:mannose-6-phosphate isomerase-like protein (cupin superfamily)